MPKPLEMDKLAREAAARQADNEPSPPAAGDEWWDAVLSDPRAAGKPPVPISSRRLDEEIPRDILRVECLRCFRAVEIQRADAVRLYGPHAVWKDVGLRLLDDGCEHRSGRHEEDGCWPDFRSQRDQSDLLTSSHSDDDFSARYGHQSNLTTDSSRLPSGNATKRSTPILKKTCPSPANFIARSSMENLRRVTASAASPVSKSPLPTSR
jgi:hypothetical protein